MTNIEVAQNWHRGQIATTDHLFTDGKTIWSYGKHFPIATKKDGKVYFNTSKYSSTTSCHQTLVKNYLDGYDCQFVNTKELQSILINSD